MNHTNGPWHIDDRANFVATGGDGKRICYCYSAHSDKSDEEAAANARLIAAAPELLSACQKAVCELNEIRARDGVPYTHQGWKASVDEDYFSSVVDECFAAIDKAEGK